MQLTKRFYNHRGVDLRSSDLIRDEQFATDMMNAQYTEGGALTKRTGYQAATSSAGGFGLFDYRRYSPITGSADTRTLTVDTRLREMNTASLTVTYSGSEDTCFLGVFVDPTTQTYFFQLQAGQNIVLNQDLGVGFDEAVPYTLTNLQSAINAVADFSASITGSGSTPAAFLRVVREADLISSPFTNIAQYWLPVTSTVTSPFALYYANRFNSDHENVSSVQIGNVIYFGSGFDETYKYDGQTFYRAGLPTPPEPTFVTSAGAITGTKYVYRIQYAQYDAAGNIIESNLTNLTVGDLTNEQVALTINNIQVGSGFNTKGAVVNGPQATTNTITVDNGHTLEVGDSAYFFDAVSGLSVARYITAVTTTTITIVGAPVTVADNAPISNNLRIYIWRSKSSAVTPSLFYLVGEIANNSFAATQVFNDNTDDLDVGEVLAEPATDRSPPPKGRYVSQWNGQMLIGGIIEEPTSLRWSDIDNAEYFPNNTNQIYIEPGNGDIITGIAPNNEVFTVHGNQSFTVISGDLSTGQIRVETIARDVGCAAHATLTDVDGVLAWLSPQGPRKSSGGQVPTPVGAALDPAESNQASRIDPVFINDGKVPDTKLQLKRAVGYSDSVNNKWLLFVPAESSSTDGPYANGNSRLYAYDRVRDAWLIWSNINAAGGFAISYTDDFIFSERRFSSFAGLVQSITYRRHNLVDAYDYADNVAPISMDYAPQWESLGEPSVLKNTIAIRVFSLEAVANNQFVLSISQEVNYQTDSEVASFDIPVTGGGYGYTAYGTEAYGDPIQDAYLHPLSRVRTRSMRPRFKNSTIHENVLITGWEIEFSTPYRPEFKR